MARLTRRRSLPRRQAQHEPGRVGHLQAVGDPLEDMLRADRPLAVNNFADASLAKFGSSADPGLAEPGVAFRAGGTARPCRVRQGRGRRWDVPRTWRVCPGARTRWAAWGSLDVGAGAGLQGAIGSLRSHPTVRTPIGMGSHRGSRDRWPHAAGKSPSESLARRVVAGDGNSTAHGGRWSSARSRAVRRPRCGGRACPAAVQDKRRSRPSHACRPFSRRASRPSASLTYRRGSCFRQCGGRASPAKFGPASAASP